MANDLTEKLVLNLLNVNMQLVFKSKENYFSTLTFFFIYLYKKKICVFQTEDFVKWVVLRMNL